jgi:hypothetical protein
MGDFAASAMGSNFVVSSISKPEGLTFIMYLQKQLRRSKALNYKHSCSRGITTGV